jgi:hypothetical protein
MTAMLLLSTIFKICANIIFSQDPFFCIELFLYLSLPQSLVQQGTHLSSVSDIWKSYDLSGEIPVFGLISVA